MSGMAGRDHPPSLKDLEGRIKTARSRQQETRGKDGPGKQALSGSGLGFGLRIAVDLLAGVAIGVFLGLVLDNWLNTTPWMMVVFLFLGAAAGMLNVYRTATGRGFAVGYHKADDAAEKPEGEKPEGEKPGDEKPQDGAAADEDRGGKS